MFKNISFLFLLGTLCAFTHNEGDGFVEPHSTPVMTFLEVDNTSKNLQQSEKISIESSNIVEESTDDTDASENDHSSS